MVTDALCYSTTDIFAAGFQDHHIGPVLGTSGNTGAGGANVWTHELMREFLPDGPFKALPRNAAMRVATDAVQLFGGSGYSRDTGIERLMRDAKGAQIYEGTNQIHRLIVAEEVLRRHAPG